MAKPYTEPKTKQQGLKKPHVHCQVPIYKEYTYMIFIEKKNWYGFN